MENLYQILEIPETCSIDDIKSSYKRLILRYHPDINESDDAEKKFMEIVQAYKILSDPSARSEYDQKYKELEEIQEIPDSKKKNSDDDEYSSRAPGKPKRRYLRQLGVKIKIFRKWIITQSDTSFISENKNLPFKVDAALADMTFEELEGRFLSSSNKFVRAEALKALVCVYEHRSFSLLKCAVGDISREVKLVAIQSIGYLKIRQGINWIKKLFPKSSTTLKLSILEAATQIPTARSRDIFFMALSDIDDDLRLAALQKIDEHNLKYYKSEIKTLSYDTNQKVKEQAKSILSELLVK